eukprot:scaffold652306_cov45-Prasinocladus_malaysianus.AAC.1
MVEWQPSCSSVILAEHLELLASKGKLPGGWDLAGAMFSRVGAFERQCRSLLSRGYVLQALRYCQRHR